jgi:alpha-aminoadipic semialdehyde synthase
MTKTLARRSSNGKHIAIDVLRDVKTLEVLIRQANVVVSFFPATFHPMVAQMCIVCGSNLVTASYESNAMRDMHLRAKTAGITIINEVGLDP